MDPARESFARFEYDGWQRAADRYELAWSGLTRSFVPELLAAAGIAAGQRVLDVACGPGYVAESVRANGATPVGIDFSPVMIRLARARTPEIEFRVGDAQCLDLPDASFEA